MSEQKRSSLNIIAINKNVQLKRLITVGDKISAKITSVAGSTPFLLLNAVWFVAWILINTGQFGEQWVFDEYPFGLLTMVVSLEAIILSIFVLLTQNRQSKHSELRSELDYITDLQADVEIDTLARILERLAKKQGIDISDLLVQLEARQKKILREHPLTKDAFSD